jgi:hypothetical protein
MSSSNRSLARRQSGGFRNGGGRNVRDFIISGVSLTSTGAPTGTLSAWGGLSVLPDGVNVCHYLLVAIIPSPATSTPSIGRLRIDKITGRVSYWVNSAGNPSAGVVVSIYPSELNNTTTLWHVRNPAVPADAARDDYLFLKGGASVGQPETIVTSACEPPSMNIDLSPNMLIGGGQGIILSVANGFAAPGTSGGAYVLPHVRTQVGPAA